jgi:hypothetical protein
MPSPGDISGAFSGVLSYNFGAIMRWVGFALYGLVIGVVGLAVTVWLQYKYKVVLREIEGNTISRTKWERARAFKKNGILKWKLLLRRKEIKPVDFEYIYPGKKVYLLRSGQDTFTPMKERQQVVVEKDGGVGLVTSIKPLDEDVTYWYQLQQQEIAKDYLPDDAAKKNMYLAIGTVVLCLLACVVTVYIIFKNVQPLVGALDNVAKAPVLQNVADKIAPN